MESLLFFNLKALTDDSFKGVLLLLKCAYFGGTLDLGQFEYSDSDELISFALSGVTVRLPK